MLFLRCLLKPRNTHLELIAACPDMELILKFETFGDYHACPMASPHTHSARIVNEKSGRKTTDLDRRCSDLGLVMCRTFVSSSV